MHRDGRRHVVAKISRTETVSLKNDVNAAEDGAERMMRNVIIYESIAIGLAMLIDRRSVVRGEWVGRNIRLGLRGERLRQEEIYSK